MKDRKKRFFEVTLAGSGHVTVLTVQSQRGRDECPWSQESEERESSLWKLKLKVRVGVVEDREKEFLE